MVTRDSHRLANEPDPRESDTDSQGGPHMVRVAEPVMVTRDSHRLANEPDSRESDTDSHTPICESTNTGLRLLSDPVDLRAECAQLLRHQIGLGP